MCYAEFQDILPHIADVIPIECSRSQREMLDTFGGFYILQLIYLGVKPFRKSSK